MVFKTTNSINGITAHRDKIDTLWSSGDAQTHTLTPAQLPDCRIDEVVGVGVGPATTTKRTVVHGPLCAPTEETGGEGFTTPGAAPATLGVHPAANEAANTPHDAKVAPRRHPNGIDAPTPTRARDRNERVPGTPEEPTKALVKSSCHPEWTPGGPARIGSNTPLPICGGDHGTKPRHSCPPTKRVNTNACL